MILINKKKVRIIIIFFDDTVEIKWDETLDKAILEYIWLIRSDQSTIFDKAFEKYFENI